MTRTGPNAGTTNYVWDNESRLVSINGQTTASYTYNGVDARVTANDGQTRTFRRDGTSVTSPVLSDGQATYTPGISERRGAVSRFMHSGLKNAESRTVSSTSIESVRTYDAFGNVLSTAGGSWTGAFGYGGAFGYQEDPSGLKLLGHRYYDSETGRFISRDFIEAGRNLYAYCDNNPLKRVDENGLDWHDPTKVIVDPNFDGKVWVVGEPKKGEPQIFVRVKPGSSSPAGMDVDLVIVQHKNGKQERYFVPGTNGPQDPTQVESTYVVDSKGKVHAIQNPQKRISLGRFEVKLPRIPVLPPKKFGPKHDGGYPTWPFGGTGNWNDDIEAAKRQPGSKE